QHQWNACEKLAAIAYLENHPQKSIHATTIAFNIETVQQKLMETSPYVWRLSNGFYSKYPELEVVLSQWVRKLRQ
ncbi:22103_t:CDS:2, partial [Gigaspora margarita]